MKQVMKRNIIYLILFVALYLPVQSAYSDETVRHFVFGTDGESTTQSFVGTSTLYSDSLGYGLIPSGELESGTRKGKSYIASEQLFYFQVQLPEGKYRVTLTLGGHPEGSHSTIKAESRRLLAENLKTKLGKFLKKTVVIDVRTPRISDDERIRIKPRERNYLNWDNKLSVEFNGDRPSVSEMIIERIDRIPVIFLAGNSTVTDQENEPWASWGQMLPNFLKPSIVVANYAESGESLRGFKGAGRLKKILSVMQPGDYLFIEFAHNDQKPGGGYLEAFTTYKEELKHYISEARSKGGIPVLVTSTSRRRFDEAGKLVNTLGDYPEAMRQVAAEEKVMLIDLNAMSKAFYEALGEEKSKKAFVHYPANTYPGQPQALADNTHFSPYGAYELAKAVVQSIVQQKLPLKKHVVRCWKTFDPAQPDSPETFRWYESLSADVLKPDGN